MKFSVDRLATIALSLFASLLIIALVRNYSDVPFWDMWDGYLEFYNRLLDGDLSAWWYQHNEHRIVLSRLLFWIDLTWFGGKSIFLIVVNFLLVVFTALIMGTIFRRMYKAEPYTTNHKLLYILCLTLPLSWMQKANLAWAFQSQFFLAQLLPLLAFYCFYLSEKRQSTVWFGISLSLGVLSAGTMANGVVVLPLLTVVALLCSNLKAKKSLIYGAAAVAVLTFYFMDYQSPSGHGSLMETLLGKPVDMLKYTALYIGSPIHFLLNTVLPSSWSSVIFWVSLASGFLLMLGSLFILLKLLKNKSAHTLELALLGYVVYVGATAFGTSGGRLAFGLEQALEGRYRTPAILLWLCFLMLSFKAFNGLLRQYYVKLSLSCLLSIFLFLSVIPQVEGALSENRGTEFDRNLGTLAMTMNIKDSERIAKVYPWIDSVMVYAQHSIDNEISIFSRGSRFYKIGEPQRLAELRVRDNKCRGSVDEIIPVTGNSKYFRIRGWLFDEQVEMNTPYSVLSSAGDFRGNLLVGKARPDVADAISPQAKYSGFGGYIKRDSNAGKRIYISLEEDTCWLELPSTDLPFEIAEPDWAKVTVTADSILENNGWEGNDYDNTQKNGFKTLGSFISGDHDTGFLELSIRNGDSLLLKTGPVNNGQFIRVETNGRKGYQIPIFKDWTLLTFRLNAEVTEELTIQFLDEGTGWGQWSAIAIKDE